MSLIMNTIKMAGWTALGALLACQASAHERYMLPSHTLLSGDKPQSVTVTASISNAIFHPDRPLADSNTGADVGDLKDLFAILQHQVIAPNGKVSDNTKWQAFARMSVADIKLEDSGTYRIGLVQPDVAMTTFTKADGTPWRVFGKAPKLPEGATNIVRRTTSSRVEAFVSLNSPTDTALKATGVGVELAGESHPNDIFAGEKVSFQLLFNGKPLTMPARVKLIKAGTRHRNDRNEQIIKVGADGKFGFTPSEAGFYFLSAETKVKVPQPADVDIKHYSLYLSLEVFPE